jgi:hypothetical protein
MVLCMARAVYNYCFALLVRQQKGVLGSIRCAGGSNRARRGVKLPPAAAALAHPSRQRRGRSRGARGHHSLRRVHAPRWTMDQD